MQDVRSINYAVGNHRGGLGGRSPAHAGIHHVVGVFANERADVVELTEVPTRMSEWEGFGGRRGWSAIGLVLISPTIVGSSPTALPGRPPSQVRPARRGWRLANHGARDRLVLAGTLRTAPRPLSSPPGRRSAGASTCLRASST